MSKEFKIYDGTSAELAQVPLHDGYMYFTNDNGDLYVDAEGKRMQTNANTANYLKDSNNKNVSADDMKDTAYQVTLLASGWVQQGNTFEYNYLNTNLICGDGSVPPIITCTSNLQEYSNIDPDTTEATAGSGIIFRTSKQPAADISIVIIDHK